MFRTFSSSLVVALLNSELQFIHIIFCCLMPIRKMNKQPAASLPLHSNFWLLWLAIGLTCARATICPVISPNDELIYIADIPSKVLAPVKKTECALECAQVTAYVGAPCRCFNYNETSSNCSIFNFEPTTYAVDQSGNNVAYQVRRV
jgi:PAN domain